MAVRAWCVPLRQFNCPGDPGWTGPGSGSTAHGSSRSHLIIIFFVRLFVSFLPMSWFGTSPTERLLNEDSSDGRHLLVRINLGNSSWLHFVMLLAVVLEVLDKD